MTPEQRSALRSTVADLIGRTVDNWNGYNRQRPELFAEIASRLDAEGLLQSPESAAELVELRARANAAPVKLSIEQRDAIAQQLGETKPAEDGLLAHLAESVRNVREHEHPTWEDLYCVNQVSWSGERMAPVLRRLLDAESRVAELEAPALERAKAGLARLAADVQAAATDPNPEHTHNSVMARGEMDEPLGYYICGICGKRAGGEVR